ncbi:MAG: MMPL family transporter [Deltaproteobacteria bacterium]|nr:MMPL family transporter [Deltaproteobacteria bacterium]
MSDRRIRGLTLVSLAILGAFCFTQLEFSSSITHFIPSRAEAELVQLSLELIDSPLVRHMVLSVEGGPERTKVAAELADTLRDHPEVAWVEAGFDEDTLRGIYELYFERRVYLGSLHPEQEIPELLSASALEDHAAGLRARLAGPDAMLVARAAPGDPLNLFDRLIARMRAFQPPADDGVEAGDFALVQVGLRSSPFDSERQRGLLRHIEAEFARIAEAHGGEFLLEQSGANRFAVDAERKVHEDVNLISALSISVVCGLFLLVFRSLRHLLIAIITPIGGFAAALAVTIATTPSIHGITLAFGFVLIGVAIDYPIHLMNHHAMAGAGATPRDSVARIRGSLLLSGATTTLAFLSLSLSRFPGLGEMGTFAAIGVPVSLLLTIFVLPAFLTQRPTATPTQQALSAGFLRLTELLGRRPALLWLALLGFIGVAAVGMPQLHWQDDPSKLMTLDAGLLAEASRVQHRVGEFDGSRFVVGLAPDPESALVLNERIYDRLTPLVLSGEIEGVGSLSAFLFSESLQQRNLSALRSVPDLHARIDTAFRANDFKQGAFAQFTTAVEAPGAQPLRPEDLRGSPLERVLAALVELDGRFVVVTLLRGVGSGEVLREALEGLEGVYYIDQREIMAGVYEGYRRSTVRMVAVGAIVVLIVLQIRYRRPVRGLLAFLPAALAASTTLGLFGLFDVPVNVVNAISLLVVLGMGVDYGVFAVDAAADLERQGSTLTSLLISCTTSVFVFGVLALSGQPVLRAIGLTTGVGVLLALALSPLVLALARRTSGR